MGIVNLKDIVRKISSPIPVIAVCTILLFSLSFLIVASLQENSPGRLQYWITILGGVGIATLLFFLVANAYVLIRQLQRKELGSRLTTKLVLIFLFLMVIPFSVIYYFSIQFLNKGVDSWFDVRIEQTVNDSLLLSQTALEGIKEEIIQDVHNFARNFARTLQPNVPRSERFNALEEFRKLEKYNEVSLFLNDGRVLAFSNEDASQVFPDYPGDEVFNELSLNYEINLNQSNALQNYTLLESLSDQTQQIRVVVPIPIGELGLQFVGLQVIKVLPLRYATLANSVETANNQYAQMVFARAPLKFSLIVTLTLISLASLLFSLLTAVYLSRRLVAPISNLAAGTRRIAEGDYGSELPITSSDELGILTGSFNNMSRKIYEAQQTAAASQTETEDQKGYLEAVLTNLSSGVFSFDASNTLEICNSAASEILGLEKDSLLKKSIKNLKELNQQTSIFFERIEQGIQSGKPTWQDEVTLLGQHGRQIVIIRGSVLSNQSEPSGEIAKETENHVVVFDDVTNLIQAQRDAAWGEVARRLAHEIKNPLTPIQLSAERIKAKLHGEVADSHKEMLDRSTRTIVQQVESMKDMVNDFSSYAQPVRAKLAPLNVNQLIRDVMELHASMMQKIDLEIELADELPSINANAGALRQVLNNLVINACHALENVETAKLRVSSQHANNVQGQYIDILIEDSGKGIPVEIRESIFDPYVSSKAKGSGLGLAIVKRIVEEHGGSVWTHAGIFEGTAMQLRLPINAMQSYHGNRP